MAKPKNDVSQTIQQERRRLLIDSTMTAISLHGLSKLTLAKITSIAGLTAGTVNFHFDSKEALLLETLKFVSEEFEHNVETALALAGSDPVKRLQALIGASLDREITESRKMAVWFAFLSEGRSRDDYQRICGDCDRNNLNIITQTCQKIIDDADRTNSMSAKALASALSGLIDEVWQAIIYAGDDYDREDAKKTCHAFLASVFPWCFDMPQQANQTKPGKIKIQKATVKHTAQVAILFDRYRQFYHEDANLRQAKTYIEQRLKNKESTIFIALDEDNNALGFTQLYPSFCSVEGGTIWILYDLYVDEKGRKQGIAKALMNQALQLAKETNALRIDLETANDNYPAQALYEQLGYQRETVYYKYSLATQ